MFFNSSLPRFKQLCGTRRKCEYMWNPLSDSKLWEFVPREEISDIFVLAAGKTKPPADGRHLEFRDCR